MQKDSSLCQVSKAILRLVDSSWMNWNKAAKFKHLANGLVFSFSLTNYITIIIALFEYNTRRNHNKFLHLNYNSVVIFLRPVRACWKLTVSATFSRRPRPSWPTHSCSSARAWAGWPAFSYPEWTDVALWTTGGLRSTVRYITFSLTLMFSVLMVRIHCMVWVWTCHKLRHALKEGY